MINVMMMMWKQNLLGLKYRSQTQGSEDKNGEEAELTAGKQKKPRQTVFLERVVCLPVGLADKNS